MVSVDTRTVQPRMNLFTCIEHGSSETCTMKILKEEFMCGCLEVVQVHWWYCDVVGLSFNFS